tara:strand:+ start:1774 stop:2082 length:309 start_codon:yes stop_codon:yes gene_type:complete
VELLYFVLAAYGLTQILVYGSVFDSIRPTEGKLGELFRCSMCMGFWSGILLFGINDWTELFSFEYSIANLLILGWLSSGTSYVLNMIFGDKGIKYEHTHLDS